jgi:hypothetical protein
LERGGSSVVGRGRAVPDLDQQLSFFEYMVNASEDIFWAYPINALE